MQDRIKLTLARRPAASTLLRALAPPSLIAACLWSCDSASHSFGECVHPAPVSQADASSRWSAIGSGLEGVPENGPVPGRPPDHLASQVVHLPDAFPAGPRATIFLQATHLRDGAPATGRHVSLYFDRSEAPGQPGHVSFYAFNFGLAPRISTGSDGWAAFEVPAGEPLTIRVRPEDTRSLRREPPDLDPRSPALNHGIALVPALREGERRALSIEISGGDGRTFCGRLVDVAGAGIPGVEVWALPDPRQRLDPEQLFASGEPVAVSDAQGMFCVTYLGASVPLLLAREGLGYVTIAAEYGLEYPSAAKEYALQPEASMCVRLAGDGPQGVTYRARVSTVQGLSSRDGAHSDHWTQVPTEWSQAILVGGQVYFDRLPPDVLLQVELLDSDGAVLQHTTLHAPLGSEVHLVEVLKL